MGKMKDLALSVEDMINNGYDFEDISVILGVPLDTIKSIFVDIDTQLELSYDSPERWPPMNRIEWDCQLWTYVVYYKGQKVVLNVDSIDSAEQKAKFIILKIDREENEKIDQAV